jgi:hypothetical protein
MTTRRKFLWSFWWLCDHCQGLRLHLVDELMDQEQAVARCSECTTLMPVTEDHRVGAVLRQPPKPAPRVKS